MVYTARIDVAPIKQILILTASVTLVIVAAIILGETGPGMLEYSKHSVYDCPHNEHIHFNSSTCNGVELSLGGWSPTYEVETLRLNKHWYLRLTMFTNNNLFSNSSGITSDLRVYANIQGRKQMEENWNIVTNSSVLTSMFCPEKASECPSFILIYEESIDWDVYSVEVKILEDKTNLPVPNLADVELTFIKDSPEFSKMSLILKVLFLGISIGIFAFHYLKLKGKKSYWASWTDEQRLFLFLLLALVCYNNPFFPLEFIVRGWFLSFFGSMLELVFTCILFAFWFIIAQKIRSPDNVLKFDLFLKLTILLVALYAILATVLFGLASARDEQSPLYGITDHINAIQIIYYITSAVYIAIIIIFFAILVIAVQPVNEKIQLRARFFFFAIPTLIVIISILVGIFLGIIGPFGRDAPSFVYFLVLYNIYTYTLLWGFWPVEAGFEGYNNPTEETRIFAEAIEPKT